MADIKQAAKWMLEGKEVGRKSNDDLPPIFARKCTKHPNSSVATNGLRQVIFHLDSLLADDWELLPRAVSEAQNGSADEAVK